MTQSPLLIDGSKFEIREHELLGRGAYGSLCRGRERSSERGVAVRILSPQDGGSATALAGVLRRYAELLAPLDSSGIVPIVGFGECHGRIFYAMDLVAGESLATCVAQSHRFTTDEIIHVAEGISAGLRIAWKQGLAPCGIKPTSVFLTAGGAVRMADVGLAKFLAEPLHVPIARAQGRYVAPEQIFGEPADIRSDIYSMGVMLYELATRKLPFEGYDSTTSFYYQLLHVDPAAPRELGASIPRELERLVLRCLAKNPSDRYQTPDELLEDLQAVRRRQGSSTNVAGVVEDDPGDFDIYDDQVIGEGGMGILYRARQHSLGRPVAVKVIRDIFTASPEFVQRFRQEAELLAQVNHPNVVQVFGTGTWRGRLFYAMELVDGQDVASRLKEKQRFSQEEVLHVAEGVTRALAAAWKYRIVHRDIKPSNILLTSDGSVKVADFGLAKSLRISKTDSRLIAGTSEYISPEQGMGRAVDIRSDIYSLGVVLYELLMGRPPFKSDGSFTFVVYQHVHSAPPPLDCLVGAGSLSPPVNDIIHKCLEKRPEDRYQSPEEMLSAVLRARSAIQHRATAASPAAALAAAPTSSMPAAHQPGTGRWRNLALVFVMLLGVACALFALLHRPGVSAASPAPNTEYDLMMGIGEYSSAMRFAEARWGRSSRQYLEATSRQNAATRLACELRVRDALHRHDWKGAAHELENAVGTSERDHDQGLRAALRVCQDLASAESLEEDHPRESLDLYRRIAQRAAFLEPYIRESIERLQKSLRAPAK